MAKTVILVATNTEYDLGKRYFAENAKDLEDVVLIKTGVGKTNVMLKLVEIYRTWTFEEQKNRTIINIGLCGSNIEGDKKLNVHRPTNFIDGDRDLECEFTKHDLYPITEGNSGITLVSSSKFVTKDAYDNSIYDMEAFDIKAFCDLYADNFICLKIVSDFCNSNSEKDYIAINKEQLYQVFKGALDEYREFFTA